MTDFKLPTWHHWTWNWKEDKHNQLSGADMPQNPYNTAGTHLWVTVHLHTHTDQSSALSTRGDFTQSFRHEKTFWFFVCCKTLCPVFWWQWTVCPEKTPTLFRMPPMDCHLIFFSLRKATEQNSYRFLSCCYIRLYPVADPFWHLVSKFYSLQSFSESLGKYIGGSCKHFASYLKKSYCRLRRKSVFLNL